MLFFALFAIPSKSQEIQSQKIINIIFCHPQIAEKGKCKIKCTYFGNKMQNTAPTEVVTVYSVENYPN